MFLAIGNLSRTFFASFILKLAIAQGLELRSKTFAFIDMSFATAGKLNGAYQVSSSATGGVASVGATALCRIVMLLSQRHALFVWAS